VKDEKGVRRMRIEDMDLERIKCANCGWEGGKDGLVARKGDLIFYDHTMNMMYNMGITRWNLHCPVCAGVLKTVRKFPEEGKTAPNRNKA
jgi:hypothetical protein